MAKWQMRGPAHAKRIERDGETVATALQLGNGLWELHDKNESRRLRHQRWSQAKDLLAFVKSNPEVIAA